MTGLLNSHVNLRVEIVPSTVAIRIIRSAQEIGWNTVSIYTDNDSSHATFADDAVKLENVSRFLDVGHIVEIARR